MSSIKTKKIRILQTLQKHTSDVTCVEFWGSSRLITGSSDKSVRLWKWISGEGFIEENFSPLLGHKYGVTCIRVSPQGGVLASSSVDGTIILWDISNGSKAECLYQKNGEAIRTCCFSYNGTVIASADDSGSVCLWGRNKNLLRTLQIHDEAVHVATFAPDSTLLLTGCTMGNIRITLMDISDSDQDYPIACMIDNAHDLGVLSTDFCKSVYTDPSDDRINFYTFATGGTDQFLKLWRLTRISTINDDLNESSSVLNFSNTNTYGSAIIYSTETVTATFLIAIEAHASSVTSVKFNSQGNFIVTSSLDKTIKIWDLQGNCLHTLTEHVRYVNCVSIDSHSSMIASGSNDRSVIIWDLVSSASLAGDSFLYEQEQKLENIATDLMCPITNEILKDPVIAADGFTYERNAIVNWFQNGKTVSPMTSVELQTQDLISNDQIKEKISMLDQPTDFINFSE